MGTAEETRTQRPQDEEDELVRMSFGDHLDELRKRLLRALAAMFVAMLALLPFKDQVMSIIVKPYRMLWAAEFKQWIDHLEAKADDDALKPYQQDWLEFIQQYRGEILEGTFEDPQVIDSMTGFKMNYALVATGGLEDFWTFMMGALIFALALASPVVIWQLWAFIAAGLYKRERKVFYRYFPFSMGLMVLGVLFGYFLAVPYGLGFLVRIMKIDQVQPLLSVSQYFSILFTLTTALGIVFQLPLVMVGLNKMGLVTHDTFRKQWRFVVLGIFVVSAMFTPPDPFTLFLMALPTVVLYAIGLLLTARSERVVEEEAAR